MKGLFPGCQAPQATATNPSAPAVSNPSPSTTSTSPVVKEAPHAIRIKAGSTDGFTDSQGHKWLADQGFTDGDTIERPDATIANTTDVENPQINGIEIIPAAE